MISQIDKSIIKILNDRKDGLTEKPICGLLGIEPKNRTIINKRLNKLCRDNIINKINSCPKIYYVGMIDRNDIIKVKCSKCNRIDIVYLKQSTTVCSNCGNRYWITNKRMINYKGKKECYPTKYQKRNLGKIRARSYARKYQRREFCLLCLLEGMPTRAEEFHHTDYESYLGFSVCIKHHRLADRWLIQSEVV